MICQCSNITEGKKTKIYLRQSIQVWELSVTIAQQTTFYMQFHIMHTHFCVSDAQWSGNVGWQVHEAVQTFSELVTLSIYLC